MAWLLFFLFLLTAPDLQAALVFDSASQGAAASGGATTVSFSHTTTALGNRCLIVGCGIDSNTLTITGITYGAAALTLYGRRAGSGQNQAEVWYLLNPPAGTATLTATLSALDGAACIAMTWSGCLQASPPFRSAAVDAQNSTGGPTLNIPDGLSGDVVVGCAVIGSPEAMTNVQGVERGDIASAGANSMQLACTTVDLGATGAQTISWTLVTGGGWAEVGGALQPAALVPTGGGGPFVW
jgi:hypothetical protein